MSPFWLLAVGLGVAFMIGSGRAGAIWQVITGPVTLGQPFTSPSTTPSPSTTGGPVTESRGRPGGSGTQV